MSCLLNASRIRLDAVLLAFVNGVGWLWDWLAVMVLVECLSSCSNGMNIATALKSGIIYMKASIIL